MNIAKDNEANLQKLKTIFVLLLVMVIGIVTFTTPSITAEAKTLSSIVDGRRETSQSNNNAQKYSYLLNGNTNKGFLPDIKNLSKYGYGNQGWGINTPSRGRGGDGGRELTHSVFPSQTEFRTVNGVDYLRITGTAVAPKYFHHTDKNHQVAILTREDGKDSTIKSWKASLMDLTSSASYDYGYGSIDGNTDWRAAVSQDGHGLMPIHVTNDPYPLTAEKASGKGVSKYFDNNYGSMFGVNSFNTSQISKLCGLGTVGNDLTDVSNSNWVVQKHGCTYIMDYSGFIVDIPVSALISSSNKAHSYDFNIVLTMTTPNSKEARVYGQPLHIPGVPKNTTTVLDVNEGYEGVVTLAPSDIGKVKYQPLDSALRNFKRTSNFSANHYNKDTNITSPSKQTRTGTYSFPATKDKPRFVGWGMNKFGSGTWNEIEKNKGSVEFVENRGYGRGEMWVGWSLPSLSKHKMYTAVGNAYTVMPSATMKYKPQTKVKPVVVRHRIINNGNYRNPGTVFKTDANSVRRGGGNITAKPLTGSSLTSLGSNMKYLGKSRVGGDPINDAVTNVANEGVTLNNSQLFSKEFNGDGTLYIDFYYSGSAKVPSDPEDILMKYDVEHRVKGTNKVIEKGESGYIYSGQSHTVSAIRPTGYTSTNEYKVNNGGTQRGVSYSFRNTSDKDSEIKIVFYYEQREMDIEVEHKNRATGRPIAKTETGAKVVIGENYLATPISDNQLNGYKYSNRYSVNGGNQQSGANYRVTYNDEMDKATVTFYYDWIQPEDSTKRYQGDTGGKMPIDTYINAGLITERDANGKVTGTKLEANTSAILDTFEAPIAISPKGGSIKVGSTRANMSGTNTLILNNEYLETVSVDSRVGNSADAKGFNESDVDLDTSTLNMTLGTMGSTKEARNEGLGLSKGILGTTEDKDVVGRWVGSDKRNIKNWTPMGIMSAGLTYEGDVNAVDKVEVNYNMDVYNIMRHNYESRVGKDGLEFYQYTGTEILPGAYSYDASGNVLAKKGQGIELAGDLNISDIGVGDYVDSEGFNNGTGQIAPTQFKVASEEFRTMGMNATGYSTDTITKDGAETVIRGTDNYKEEVVDEFERVNSYEEFAYAPHNTEDALITQQAVPVGGKIAYVNPYEYSLLPSRGTSSVMERSGVTVGEIEDNVGSFVNAGQYLSNLEFDPTHTGFYVSDKDEFETFNMATTTTADKNFMENSLATGKQHSTVKSGITTNYETYQNSLRGRNSGYTQAGAVQSTGHFKYKQPITYAYGMRELMLEDVVAVGKDTGFPVVGESSDLKQTYRDNYKREFGVNPSGTDELITTNNGSVYLIPLNGEQDLSDDYKTRLFVNKIGLSQVSLVDDNELEISKYLYGRGENTIYSGQRKEVEADGEFNADQTIGKDAKPEKTKQVNGARTNNNKVINEKVLDDE